MKGGEVEGGFKMKYAESDHFLSSDLVLTE